MANRVFMRQRASSLPKFHNEPDVNIYGEGNVRGKFYLKIVTAGKQHKKSLIFHFQCHSESDEMIGFLRSLTSENP